MLPPRLRARTWALTGLLVGVLVALVALGVLRPNTAVALAAGAMVVVLLWRMASRRNGGPGPPP